MGLVMAPPLSVLPVAAFLDPATAASQGAGTTDATVTDTFAALLAMLAQGNATVSAPGKSLVDVAAELPAGAPGPAKSDDATSKDSPLAAAIAGALLLTLAAPVLPASEPATAADAARSTSAATTNTRPAPETPLAALLPSVVAVGSADTPVVPDNKTNAAAAAIVRPEAESSVPSPVALAEAMRSASAVTTAVPDRGSNAAVAAIVGTKAESNTASPAAPALADALRLASPASTPATDNATPQAASPIPGTPAPAGLVPKPPAEVQPPGAAATQGIEISVVRSVGNAKQTQTTGDGTQGGANPGQKQEPASPTPEAQSASSAAAVTPTLPNGSPAPTVPAAQAAAPVHTAPQPVQQVARAVIDSAEHGGGEVHIRLDPPELGAVSIHVRIDGNRVQVQVQAERSEAMNLLRQNTIDLSSLLGNRGLNLTDVNVGLGGRQAPGGDRASANQNAGSSNGEFASILGVDETPATELHNRLQSAYNPDGLHIYRV